MEEFYTGAKDADYIIYNSTIEGELSSMQDLLAKSPLLEKFKAVKEGHVYCTTKNLYQSTMELGTITSDIRKMLTGDDADLTYLYMWSDTMKKQIWCCIYHSCSFVIFIFGFEYMHRKCKYTDFGDTENAVGKWSG